MPLALFGPLVVACLELLLAQLVYRLATGSAHNPRLSVGLPPSPANPPDIHTLDYCTPDFALLQSLLQSHVTFTPSGAVDVGSTKSVQSLIHSATTKLRSLHLDPTEMGSLKLIILLNPGNLPCSSQCAHAEDILSSSCFWVV